jgi:hypothetical protein
MKNLPLYRSTESGSGLRPLPTKSRSVLRPLILCGLSAMAIFLSATAGLRADTILGTQGFDAHGGVITSNTGDVTTATFFTFSSAGSTLNQTGIFVGMPIQAGGPLSVDVSSPTGLNFSTSVFGAFNSTSISTISQGSNQADFRVDGMWTPGTFSGFSGLTGGPFMADILLSFMQAGGPDTAISLSGTLTVTEPSAVPEPSSIVMVLTGLIGGVVMFGLRRSRFNLGMG